MYGKQNFFAVLFDSMKLYIPRISINSYSYSIRRWSRIFGGTDRCPHCHYIVALISLLHYPISKSTTEATELTDSIEKSIWLRYKYEGKTNYARLISRETNM